MWITKKLKKFSHTVYSTLLCLKYPFLYPRNVFTGRHYDNWKLLEFCRNNYKEAYESAYIGACKATEKEIPKEAYQRITLSSDYTHVTYKVHGAKNKQVVIDLRDIVRYDYDELPPVGLNVYESKPNVIHVACKDEDDIKKTFYCVNIKKNRWLAFKIMLCQFINNYILQLLHCIPTWSYDDMLKGCEGWHKIFHHRIWKDMKRQLIKDNMLYSFRITDIKEKYGYLRIYCHSATKEIYRIIEAYGRMSYYKCINCGKNAKFLTGGYILPYCEDCFPDNRFVYATTKGNAIWNFCDEQ